MPKIKLDLYYDDTCFYCRKVINKLDKTNHQVGLCDMSVGNYRQELKQYGGSTQVPCLRIEQNDKIRWLYESNDIIDYLR